MRFENHECSESCSKGCNKRNICAIDNGNHGCNPGTFTAIDSNCLPTPSQPGSFGAIIPYASGNTPMTLINTNNSTVHGGVVGFGTQSTGTAFLGPIITLPGIANFAFSVPRAGTLTSLSAYFTASSGIAVPEAATVRAEIYRATPGSNNFTATGVAVNLPLPAGITAGTTVFDDTVANLSLVRNDRLLLVYTASISPGATPTVVVGTASAGITIV